MKPRVHRPYYIFSNDLEVLPALVNHKKWLDSFKKDIENARTIEQEVGLQEEIRKMRIREKAEETRKMIREGGEFPEVILKSKIEKKTRPISPSTNWKLKQEEENKQYIQSIVTNADYHQYQEPQLPPQQEHIIQPRMEHTQKVKFDLPDENQSPGAQETTLKGGLKKKVKPAWAMPTEQVEKIEDAQDEELISFMDNLDFDSYVEDVEIKNLMQSLKARVQNLKEEPDWRDKWKERLKEKTEKRKQEYLDEKAKLRPDDDNVSMNGSAGGDSKNSFLFGGEALTVSSSKTQGNISS